MNRKIKSAWIKALTSGKYTQGFWKLRYGNQNGTKHCCLGVLTELAVDAGVCSVREGFSSKTLHEKVCDWAGLTESASHPKNPFINSCHTYLSDLNDNGEHDFKSIAKIIKENL